jgi:acyl-CoA reductase-like NAD-dependent aldehyde dehydrogenase
VISSSTSTLDVDSVLSDVPAVLDRLAETHPAMALALVRALGGETSPALRAAKARVMEALAADSRLNAEVDAVVLRAKRAQDAFESWTDDRIDVLLRDLATAFADQAESLAVAAVQETGMGNVADKTVKNRFASLGVYDSLTGKIAQGPLSRDVDRRVTECAGPVGVVFGVVPVTTPAGTAIFKTLISLKGRNALILSFHHQAIAVGARVGAMAREILARHGAPLALVQWIPQRASRQMTRRFMSHPDVSLVLATGGAGLVKAAYSSGTPAIGVGPGNAPAWICADADLDRAAQLVVTSKSFDNGLICGAEHSLVVDARVAADFDDALRRHGAAVLSPDETRQFHSQAVDGRFGSIRRELVGQSAAAIAASVGIGRAYPIRLLVAPASASELGAFDAGEKMAPVLSRFTVSGDTDALTLCKTLLERVGAGHTAIIHTADPARVDRFARAMPAGRILANTQGSQGCCGMTTGLDCSMTLGCGTFGGNSTTDNVTYRHLLNIKRVAYSLG